MPAPILCISSIDWDFIWQGHQEIMSTLAQKGHRVLFVENTGVRNPQLRDLSRISHRLLRWLKSLQGFRQEARDLYVFSPLVLPFPYSRWAQGINRWLVLTALRRWMEAMDFHHPVLWTFLPTPLTLEIIRSVPHQALIYYCIDSFSDSTPAAQRIVASEQELFRRADLVFVTSRALHRSASPWAKQTHLFPFGVDLPTFTQALDGPAHVPGDLSGIPHPVVGYVGGIHQWVDQELFASLAQKRPDCSFVLVGPLQTDCKRLARSPNVFFLGKKSHQELPHYVKQFDVGLIPYRLTGYTRNVYPTKLNEYHALGKPVVSTPLPEVLEYNRRHGELVTIGDSAEDFSRAIDGLLKDGGGADMKQRLAAAKANSWASRIVQMQGLIDEVITRKTTSPLEDGMHKLRASLLRSRRLLRWSAALVLLALFVFRTPLVWFVASPLRLAQSPQPADAIVIFGGGVGELGQPEEGYQERAKQALELYQQGFAPRIFLVSGFTWTFHEADLMRALLTSLGVPRGAILIETRVSSTYEYVLRVRAVAQTSGWRSILLVTSPYHAKRADLVFRKNAPELKVVHQPVLRGRFYHRDGSVTPRQIRGIVHEFLALLAYRMKGWI
ncbi:MAG: YdcF family protein [Candidatus Omnitrophica bacterium]|nr:YdcF family protein [Candidatus Omnitrophota bacterium]